MIILKGDIVRTKSGETGEVIETWGIARTFIRLKRDSDGRSIPMFESEVVELIRRKVKK
ncbi:hypothetical protein [Paenibacillus eucommiae]|uniref:DUF2187 domain-containing protein n=1 Tax=Paenibacillus eucommiae TaxID=1355755 RepID=A0ABS4IY64_9BACL|nr:hypothetical protein [Paenibacillus eucommiae]MBP1992524.1 hypothetical protein [Paenibacillus eucommiae]